MYRAIVTDGMVECESYVLGDRGVELRDGEERMVAFVPFENLRLLVDADRYPLAASDRYAIA